MRTSTDKLIVELLEITIQNINFVQSLFDKTDAELNWRIEAKSWSILECFAHLNSYGDFYIPEIESVLNNSDYDPQTYFKSGFLGDYFAQSMKPKSKLNKMKTLKRTNPIGSKLDKNVLENFVIQQNKLIQLLERSKSVNLNKLKTGISIAKWLRIRLGDTFRFVIYHNQRHVYQAEKVVSNQLK